MEPGELFTGKLKVTLHNKAKDTCPQLSEDQVHKIPTKIRDVLFNDYTLLDYGDAGKVIEVTDENHHEPITRTLQWITKGEAAEFLAQHTPQVKRGRDPRHIQYNPDVHAEDASYDAAQKTRTFFAEEIDIYLFSIEHELVDLQIHMSRKLRSYPVYASEISNLISKLYSTDNKATAQVDSALARFIADRINCFRTTLITDKTLVASLQAFVPPNIELESLYRRASFDKDTLSDALRTLRNAVGEADTAAALLQAFENLHLSKIREPRLPLLPAGPTSGRRASDHSSGEASDQTKEAVQILQALGDKRIVRADQICSGTLLSGRDSRPNFPISNGQHLVLLPGHDHNPRVRVVCNQWGDVVELFENLSLTPIQDRENPRSSAQTQRGDGIKRQRS